MSDVCLVVDDPNSQIRDLLGNVSNEMGLHYVVQPEPLGVAHAVRLARSLVDGDFAVLMGDSYYETSLAPYIQQWTKPRLAGAVLVEPAVGPAGESMGLVRVRGKRVVEIFKAPFKGQAEWRVCGLTVLPQSAFDVPLGASAPGSGEYEIEDWIMLLIRQGLEFLAIGYAGWRRNINTPADLRAVKQRLSRTAAD